MKTDTLTTRVDENTKIEFTNVFEELGLCTSQALKIFARAVISHGGYYTNYLECHIKPDFLLIYRITNSELQLFRLASHSELF